MAYKRGFIPYALAALLIGLVGENSAERIQKLQQATAMQEPDMMGPFIYK